VSWGIPVDLFLEWAKMIDDEWFHDGMLSQFIAIQNGFAEKTWDDEDRTLLLIEALIKTLESSRVIRVQPGEEYLELFDRWQHQRDRMIVEARAFLVENGNEVWEFDGAGATRGGR
jgi:hypothetical protein